MVVPRDVKNLPENRTSELSGTSGLREKLKEKERERRRIRDRQRRLSMSLEEKERYLAKRRRNYHLRRQRQAHDKSYRHTKEATLTDCKDNIGNDTLALMPVSEISVVGSDGATNFGLINKLEKQNVPSVKSEGTEGRSQEIPKRSGRLSLSQIKHLASSLKSSQSSSDHNCQQTETDATTKESIDNICLIRKGMRLVHVKRLARALHSSTGNKPDQENLSKV